MSSFNSLPAEILVEILKSIHDLPSTLHLLHACPKASSVFTRNALHIFPALIHTLPPEIQRIVNTIACLSSNGTPYTSLHALVEAHLHRSQESLPLDKKPLSSKLRRILVLSCHVQHLAHQCLRVMNSRCMKMNMLHLESPNTDVVLNANPFMCGNFPRDNTHITSQKGKVYYPADSGPPSWVEQQRTYRALWLLQLFHELQAAAQESRLEWSDEEIYAILNIDPVRFWSPLERFVLEQFRTVKECLDDLYPDSLPSKLPRYRGSINYHWPNQVPSEPDNAGRSPCGDSPDDLQVCSAGHIIATNCLLSYARVISTKEMPYHPFRYYGTAIWDRRRLVALGLDSIVTHAPTNKFTRLSNTIYTWGSLLTKKDTDRLAEQDEVVRPFSGDDHPLPANDAELGIRLLLLQNWRRRVFLRMSGFALEEQGFHSIPREEGLSGLYLSSLWLAG